LVRVQTRGFFDNLEPPQLTMKTKSFDQANKYSDSVHGVLHPQLSLTGLEGAINTRFAVVLDGKQIEFNAAILEKIYPHDDLYEYKINAHIPGKRFFETIFIEIYKYSEHNEKTLLFVVQSAPIIRIRNKFVQILQRFYNRITVSRLEFYDPFSPYQYICWLKKSEHDPVIIQFKYNPLISIVAPVYNTKKKYLKKCINSVLRQTYANWELCLADDCSSNKETIAVLKKYEKKDSRIKVVFRKENGHISKASNDAIKMASGEFIAFLDHDDALSKHALYFTVRAINEKPETDFLYSDEDKLDIRGRRHSPFFKPDFSPDTFMSSNYICHFSVIRKSLIEKTGLFRSEYDGAQDYDLFLRVSEKTKHIRHIPQILYHWRQTAESTSLDRKNKDYASLNGKKALEDALNRRRLEGEIVIKDQYYAIRYKIKKHDRISIIIPTRDHWDILKSCLESIYGKTTYKNFEIIVVDNNSTEDKTFLLFEEYKKKYPDFKIVDMPGGFNYSRLNNKAAAVSAGDYLVLLNNDIEVITPNWLELMLGYASLDHAGAVGAKLLYPDYTIQHGGVILGLGGVAGHAYLFTRRDDPGVYGCLETPVNYSAVTGACLMINKNKYNEVGGLEEELTVAFNDVDLNIKLLTKGYYNVFLPDVELFHHESKSRGSDFTPQNLPRFQNEHIFMYDKWSDIIQNDPFYNQNYSREMFLKLNSRRRRYVPPFSQI
jgi:GT2 family glycosyltransferase